MGVTAVIPARLASTRLPRKVLADLHGKPLLRHVFDKVAQATSIDAIYVATDSDEVREHVERWNGQVLMTSSQCRSGSERIASVLESIPGDLIINVQADEPLLDPSLLDLLTACWQETGQSIVTPVFRIQKTQELFDASVVKAVLTAAGQAIYFSRAAIPYVRDRPAESWLKHHSFWGHIGVYGFSREVLAAYDTLPRSDLEDAERLEQLRFLQAGYSIQTFVAGRPSIGVDTPEDLERVRQLMASQ